MGFSQSYESCSNNNDADDDDDHDHDDDDYVRYFLLAHLHFLNDQNIGTLP